MSRAIGETVPKQREREPPRSRRLLVSVFLLPAILLLPLPSLANELSVLGGVSNSDDPSAASYGWQAALRYNFLRNFAASLSWINEGHLGEHKRDGVALQGWGRTRFLDDRASLGIGAGMYHYFDTLLLPGGEHRNLNDWAPVYSLTATYYTRNSWFAQFAFNHIHPGSDYNSNSYLAGVGYRLWKEPEPAPAPEEEALAEWTTGYEVMAFLGQVVVNSPGNEPGIGGGVEFRMGIQRHLDWTLTWLNENVRDTMQNTGLATQIWLVDEFLARRLTLGFGVGLYTFLEFRQPPGSTESRDPDLAGLLTATTSFRFSERWFTRFNWNRVMSNDHRDTDNFLLGFGYRWGR
jgi:hypothetical protein